MENILYQFNEKVISLVKSFLENSIKDGGLSNFTDDLMSEMAKLGTEIAEFVVNYAEEIIFKLEGRKEKFESLEKDSRHITTTFGDISFRRRYYLDKETKKRVYLLDEYMKLQPKQRMLENVRERLISEATESNYEKAGRTAAYGTIITKETVMNEIEKLDLNKIEEKEAETKKQVKQLYIIADEDHVHLQKGGIEEPRLVTVYEGIKNEGKRVILQGKRTFGGIYKGKIDDLWEEVMTYIEKQYDTEYLEMVYILGDGASWIKTGLEWIIKSKYVLDEFHMWKAVNGIVGRKRKNEKGEKEEQRQAIKEAIRKLNFEKFKEISYEILAEEMDKGSRKRKEQLMNYILNNEAGIRNLYSEENELHGCSAEGHVSHILSDRMSSRPMGWKTANVNNMSKLRVLRDNKVSVKEILRNQSKESEFKEIEKIRHQANAKMKQGLKVKAGSIPMLDMGTKEQRQIFENLLGYRTA